MKRALAALFAAVVMLAGCHAAQVTEAPENDEPAVQEQTATPVPVRFQRPETEAACKAGNGEWQPVCMMQQKACVNAFDDGGKACSDSSECGSGRCATADGSTPPGTKTKGVCAVTNYPCGCFQLVEKGVAGYPLCAD